MHKCRHSGKMLIVELGQNKPGMMLEKYLYSCKENLFLAFLGVAGKFRLCNNNYTTQGTCTNVDPWKGTNNELGTI